MDNGPHPIDMVRDLRIALGLPDVALPKPPKQVWEDALAEVRRLRHIAGDPSSTIDTAGQSGSTKEKTNE